MKRKIILCLLLFFSLFASLLIAQEKDDLTLFEIDRLIRKTEYDEALAQLNIYIKQKPDNFDNAQSRIKKIMNARKEYSILAEKLIDLIQTDPGNNKEIYEITAQLEKFEKHPSDQNLQFIADLKKSAEFNYFRSLFMEIQTETASNTTNGRYVAAIEKAKEGFWLYREDFDERWGEVSEIKEPVLLVLKDLETQIAAFEEKNFLPRINDAVNDFIKSVNLGQYELSLEKYEVVKTLLVNYNKVRQAIISDGIQMQNIFQQIQAVDEDITDASFLPFMFRFVYGIDSIENSGIIGAVDGQWNDFTGRMNAAVYSALTNIYDKYTDGVDQNYTDKIQKYVSLETKVLDLYKTSENNLVQPLVNPYSDYYARAEYVQNISQQVLRIKSVYEQVQISENKQIKILNQIRNEESTDGKSANINLLFELNTKLGKTIGIRLEQDLDNFGWSTSYKLLGIEDWNGLTHFYEYLLNQTFTKADELLSNAWVEICNYYRQCAEEFYDTSLTFNNCAEKYINGFYTKIPADTLTQINNNTAKAHEYEDTFNVNPELDFGIVYSYPDIALKVLKYNQNKIDREIKNLSAYETQIKYNYRTDSFWNNNPQILQIITETTDFLQFQQQNLSDLKNKSFDMASAGERKITAAQLAKNEADIRYSEAQNALKVEDFDTARRKLQNAVTKYDESLSNQNDETLRSECDLKLQQLGEKIAKAENEIVVHEVRELKTLAKDAYFNGRFDDAEKYLNQAKNRWAVTNITEDEEITNLLNFVNTAISMKDGREILPTAPQYPEMSQLLNVAYQYFYEGSRKIGEGNKSGGEEDLNLALESIQKLQYVYPLNQEAALLTLKISRLKDSKKFREEFAQRVESAAVMCKTKETQQQGYANLLDYYELEPDYQGLKNLIYQVEIDIGIRQKPVDHSDENKAKKLITEAQNIYKSAGNDEKKLQSALEKLNQALALVSDNKTAISLKDEITTKIGGNTSTVLSTEDERLYQLAIQRLQNNNVVGANAIVDQLLKKSSNANSQKIKDLKNKIEARS